MSSQHEIVTPSPLLDAQGRLAQVGWARAPLLDCNLEQAVFYPRLLRFLQPLRIKRWDYYGVTISCALIPPCSTSLPASKQAMPMAVATNVAACQRQGTVHCSIVTMRTLRHP